MYHHILFYAAAFCSAVSVHGAHLPTILTDRAETQGDVADAAPLRFRAVAGPAPAPELEKRVPVTEDGRCGTNFGTRCSDDECCSSAGWCGEGYLYCSAPSCQIEYGPSCDANIRPDGPDTEDTPRPRNGPVPYGQGVYHCRKKGVIALTYDDGPFTYTSDLLDILKDYGAKATFFVTGRNLGKGAINDPDKPWRALVKRMINEGHQVASHTWSHQRLTELTKSSFRKQMLYNEIALADILGYFPTYMRPPYSASNDNTDGWLGDMGYHVTYFNLDTEGYLHDGSNQIQESKNIWDDKIEGKDPKNLQYLQIEHDPVFQSVYNLTSYMLKSLRRNGLKSVTVGECLDDPKENWYRSPEGSRTSTSKRSMTQTTTTSKPTSTLPASKDGRCGPGYDDATCLYEPDATCCSQYGWCGATVDHCGTKCQPGYGTCGSSL